MRKYVALLILAGALALPGSAAVLTWTANLDSAQENNPANTESGTGSGWVRFNDVTNVLDLFVMWEGLTGPGMQAHIHCCVATPPGNAGIAIDLWLMDNPQPATGTYSASYDLDVDDPFREAFRVANGGTVTSAFAALRSAMDSGERRAYYNIHTMAWPGGEIRGDLAPVPEPATTAVVLSGLAALLLRRRWSRR